jgi:hypothetical protein
MLTLLSVIHWKSRDHCPNAERTKLGKHIPSICALGMFAWGMLLSGIIICRNFQVIDSRLTVYGLFRYLTWYIFLLLTIQCLYSAQIYAWRIKCYPIKLLNTAERLQSHVNLYHAWLPLKWFKKHVYLHK